MRGNRVKCSISVILTCRPLWRDAGRACSIDHCSSTFFFGAFGGLVIKTLHRQHVAHRTTGEPLDVWHLWELRDRKQTSAKVKSWWLDNVASPATPNATNAWKLDGLQLCAAVNAYHTWVPWKWLWGDQMVSKIIHFDSNRAVVSVRHDVLAQVAMRMRCSAASNVFHRDHWSHPQCQGNLRSCKNMPRFGENSLEPQIMTIEFFRASSVRISSTP